MSQTRVTRRSSRLAPLQELNMNQMPSSSTSSAKSPASDSNKRRTTTKESSLAAKRVKAEAVAKKQKQSQKKRKPPSDDESSEEEENPQSTYIKHLMMRNKIYRNVDEIESAQRRIENGDNDDSAIHKAVKHYVHSEILKAENRNIVNGRDLSIDSVLGDRLSRVLLIKAGKISSGSDKFNFSDFARKVKDRGSFGELYRRDLNATLDDTFGFKSLALADFGAPPKEKNARKEHEPKKKSDKGELIDVKGKQTHEAMDEKDATFTKQLDHVLKAFKRTLKRRDADRLNYYEFVIDPEDFGSTIQNCFCVAFLLKDMEVFLEKTADDEYPYLRMLSKDEKKAVKEVQEGGKALPANQCINTLTYAKWNGIIQRLGLEESIIKPFE